MPRQRMLQPGFFTDARVVSVSPLARLLFAGLWGIADREGRLEDRPVDFKIRLLPMDACDIHALLAELTGQGLIERYRVDGMALVQIPKFKNHQNPHVREPSQCWPAPDGTRSEPVPGRDKEAIRRLQHQAGPVPAPGQHRAGPAESESESESESVVKAPQAPQGAGDGEKKGVARERSGPARDADGNSWEDRMDAVWQAARGCPDEQSAPERLKGYDALKGKKGFTPDEAVRRWAYALSPQGKFVKSVSTWAELARHWTAFAGQPDEEGVPRKPVPPREALPPCHFPDCEQGAEGAVGGVRLCVRHTALAQDELYRGGPIRAPEVQAWLESQGGTPTNSRGAA